MDLELSSLTARFSKGNFLQALPPKVQKLNHFLFSLIYINLNSLMLATSCFLSVCSLDVQGLYLLLSAGRANIGVVHLKIRKMLVLLNIKLHQLVSPL